MSAHSESQMSTLSYLQYLLPESLYTEKNFWHYSFFSYVALRKWKRPNQNWRTAQWCATDLPYMNWCPLFLFHIHKRYLNTSLIIGCCISGWAQDKLTNKYMYFSELPSSFRHMDCLCFSSFAFHLFCVGGNKFLLFIFFLSNGSSQVQAAILNQILCSLSTHE